MEQLIEGARSLDQYLSDFRRAAPIEDPISTTELKYDRRFRDALRFTAAEMELLLRGIRTGGHLVDPLLVVSTTSRNNRGQMALYDQPRVDAIVATAWSMRRLLPHPSHHYWAKVDWQQIGSCAILHLGDNPAASHIRLESATRDKIGKVQLGEVIHVKPEPSHSALYPPDDDREFIAGLRPKKQADFARGVHTPEVGNFDDIRSNILRGMLREVFVRVVGRIPNWPASFSLITANPAFSDITRLPSSTIEEIKKQLTDTGIMTLSDQLTKEQVFALTAFCWTYDMYAAFEKSANDYQVMLSKTLEEIGKHPLALQFHRDP